jgi:hypothetical protein
MTYEVTEQKTGLSKKWCTWRTKGPKPMLERPEPPDRHRRFRARRRAGKAVASVEYDALIVDLLVRTHWLPPDELHDRDSIGRAIGAMLADAARR